MAHGYRRDILAELASAGEMMLPNCFPSSMSSAGPDRPESEPSHSTNEPALHRSLSEAQIHTSHAPGPQLSSFADDGVGTLSDGPMEPSIFFPTPPLYKWLPPDHMYTNPVGAGLEDMMANAIDSDTIAMWTNAPRGLEYVPPPVFCFPSSNLTHFRVDDWGEYFLNLSEITQTQADLGLNGHDASCNPGQ